MYDFKNLTRCQTDIQQMAKYYLKCGVQQTGLDLDSKFWIGTAFDKLLLFKVTVFTANLGTFLLHFLCAQSASAVLEIAENVQTHRAL